ncbi:MAG: hypothetical protein ACREJT_16795, partial [Myxococcota bacterium]
EGAVALQGKMGFAEAQRLRSALLSATDLGGEGLTIAGAGEAAAKQVAKSVDEAMSVAAKEIDRPAYQLWRKANKFYAKGAKFYNDELVTALAHARPEDAYRIAIANGTPENIARIHSRVDARTWDTIRGAAAEDIIFKRALDPHGEVSGKALSRVVNKTFGRGKMDAIFGKEGSANLRQIANAMEFAQSSTGQTVPGGLRIKIAQGGGAGLLLMAGRPIEAGGLVLSTEVLARLFANKRFARWATIGSRVKPGTKMAVRAASEMSAALADVMKRESGEEE